METYNRNHNKSTRAKCVWYAYGGKKKGGICSLKAHKNRLCCGADIQQDCGGENVFRHRRLKKRKRKKIAWAILRDTQRHNTPVAGIVLLSSRDRK